MATVASKTPFFQLAVLLDKIQKLSGTDNKKKLLKEFIAEWRKFHVSLHENDPNTTDSFYPVMRLLLPQLEREREAYGIKEVMLAKLYIEILGLGQGSPAADKLKNFRGPKNNKSDMGDFANTAFWILKPRCPEKGSLTIEEVNTHLDNIAKCNAEKNKDGVKKSILAMLRNMSAREQKWLIRMILKDLKLGISQQSVFSVFHEDAEDLFNVKMSLQKVCTMLKDPTVRLHEIEIDLFSPYRPMLGDRGNPSKVEKVMENKPYIIETKFDGERMQLHKKDQEYKFFSRSGNDYTHVFGADKYSGTFTPAVYNCFKPHVKNVILDGEMVGYNADTKTIGSKGQNFDIKSLNPDEYHPMLCVFDILLLNDEVLSNKPLKERKEILKDIFNPMEGRILLSETTMGRSNQDCANALNEAIDRREEGIMVKDADSPYKPNTRKGGWYKIKPEYVGGLMDELDVLVVGGYFGKGHRASLLSHFLCAVAVPDPEGGKPRRFHSFCRVGSGYTRKELYDFNDKLKNHFQVYNPKKPPAWLELLSGRQRPEIFIEPSKSYILQIKAAEITASDQYKTECTLRFPRVEKIRTDKNWYDCMTLADVKELREKSEGKLTGGYVDIDDDDGEPAKKRKKITTRHVKPTVMSAFRGVDVNAIEKVSELFSGREICVINGPSSNPKSALEKKIVECGGTIAQNPGEDTFCVLADKVAIKVRNIISKGIYDVVKVDWLLSCINNNRFRIWVPSDMIHTSPQTEKLFALDYDKYGDSYFEDTTEEELRKVFQKVEEEDAGAAVASDDIAGIEMRNFPQDAMDGLFRLCRVYVDSNAELGKPETALKASPLELTSLDLRGHGATVVNSLDKRVTHVIVHQSDRSRVRTLREMNRSRDKKFHVLTSDWVEESIDEEKMLSERPYEAAMMEER